MDTFTSMENQLNGTRADRNAELVHRDQKKWARRAVRRYADTTDQPDVVADHLLDVLGLEATE